MRDRSKDRHFFIQSLAQDLRRHGLQVQPPRPSLDLSHLPELRKLLGQPNAFGQSGISGVVARESDYGYLAGNIENADRRMKIVGVLGEIGVVPRIAVKDAGFLHNLSRSIDGMLETDGDLRFTLGEMAQQGLRELRAQTEAPDNRASRDILASAEASAEDFARAHGLDLVRAPDPDRMMSFPEKDLVALLKDTDPDMGLGSFQSGMVFAAKPGIAGMMRQSFTEGNLREAVQKLAEAGFAPVLALKPFEATKGAGFFGRIKEKAAYILDGPDLDNYSRDILAFGRDLLRVRIEDLMHERRVGQAPDIENENQLENS